MNILTNIISSIFIDENSQTIPVSSVVNTQTRQKEIFEERYILSATQISKHNLIICNINQKDSYNILKMVINRLCRLENIKSYSKDIITCDSINRVYKKIFIDDPNMYFTGFIAENEVKAMNKKYIHIYPQTKLETRKPGGNNIYIDMSFSYSSEQSTLYSSIYRPLLINKRDTSIELQKKFFDNIISKLVNCNYNEYSEIINNEGNDIEYIIIKNKQLFFC